MAITITDKGPSADVQLYGEVLSSTPTDWWTGEPIEGDFIDVPTVKTELKKLADKEKVNFYINSCGGDYYAGVAIYNQIKQLKGEVNIIVDGLAASAASVIAMAGHLSMNVGSVLMIHPSSAFLFGYYNKQELNEIIKSHDTVTKSAVSIYSNKNKVKSKEEIETLMNNTTWLVDSEAVDYGFADEVLSDNKKQVQFKLSAKGDYVIANGVKHNIKYFDEEFTKNLETEKTIAMSSKCWAKIQEYFNKENKNSNVIEDTETGKEKEIMCNSVEELKEQFPQLCDELMHSVMVENKEVVQKQISDAVLAERKRIEEIEEIENSIADNELVKKAKFSESEIMNAKDLAFESIKSSTKVNDSYLKDLEEDNSESGVNNIKTETPPVEMTDAEKEIKSMGESAKSLAQSINK